MASVVTHCEACGVEFRIFGNSLTPAPIQLPEVVLCDSCKATAEKEAKKMVHIIVKPTRREREANLAESRTRTTHRNVEGVVRTTEEAYEIERQRAKEGHEFIRPYAVSADAPESKQAEAELLIRQGFDPDKHA